MRSLNNLAFRMLGIPLYATVPTHVDGVCAQAVGRLLNEVRDGQRELNEEGGAG